ECAKPSEGDVFEPFESRQQAKCACLRLKGGPDALLSGIRGGLRGYLGKIRSDWGRKQPKTCFWVSVVGGKEILQRSLPFALKFSNHRPIRFSL
ncbi:hypothetical protein, partial [Neisseria mucosa]|uniref:hypothetical protein n=1 Tax=Neisseria mucosa TaxID=488 RepID=UPI00280C294A